MGLSVTGFLLEGPRVGQSNSPFTLTPNNYVSDQVAFDTAYPADESTPRTEYLVLVRDDFVAPGTGPSATRSFADASFGWTKNEVVQRFDYLGRDGVFWPLPGSTLEVVGTVSPNINVTRIQVTIPVSANTVLYPLRVSVGTSSGTTLTVSIVLDDSSFGSPPIGTVELSLSTGNLNWNVTDLTTYDGQSVRFQRQTFFTYDLSTGLIGVIDDVLLLNPLPATGQFPLIKIGFGQHLTPIERANEAAFSLDPVASTVEWARDTGRLKFNSGDIAANAGRSIYYDGVLLGFDLRIKIQTLGTVASPGSVSPIPPEDSDLFFRVSGVVQFPTTSWVDTLTTPGERGVVQVRRSTGQVRFSDSDQVTYGAMTAQALVADLDIDHGITLRLFRTPVNLDDADSTIKDVSAFYTTIDATWADPIIASPTVSLPAVPVDTEPLLVTVAQGIGSFTGPLPRLDVLAPPDGLGYILNFETRELLFAEHKTNVVIPAPVPYGAVQLPDPLVQSANLVLELETSPGSGTYTPLTIGEDALFDGLSGTAILTSTQGTLVTQGVGDFSSTAFTDSSADFGAAGVLVDDYLIVLTGVSKGVYRVALVTSPTSLLTDVPGPAVETGLTYEIRRGAEILADRFLRTIPRIDPLTSVERLRALEVCTNSPRLAIDPVFIDVSRFRFGTTVFSTTVTVPNDGSFTAPTSLPAGTVEISLATGNLNFSQVDVVTAAIIFWSRELTFDTDYLLQPETGFIQFTERMLSEEEAFITYRDSDGNLIQERGVFLVRKELVQAHPAPTSILLFNPLGREVASNPAPRAFRGGRPQTSEVAFDVTTSTVTFQGSTTVTDALPSGPTIDPSENVYIDYYVYGAIGGEQSLSVLLPPMQSFAITITEGTSSFDLAGDQTDNFYLDGLLVVAASEAYLIGTTVYNSGPNTTTITLLSPQSFRSDFRNPSIQTSSEELSGSYFIIELGTYDPVPRGSNVIQFVGDVTTSYKSGTVTQFVGSELDYNIVQSAVYDEAVNRTTVTVLSGAREEYTTQIVLRSIRPVFPSSTAQLQTSLSLELSQPYTVYRRVTGQVGTILVSPDDYTIDGAGSIRLAAPFDLQEEVGIFYTGDTVVTAGRRFRASYTFATTPSQQNGLLGQVLLATYTAFVPDTFFYRVETYTNFRGELAEQYREDATASVPTGGPILENMSSPQLFEQGRESVFFEEAYLTNEDTVARPTLKYYNDAINYLEDVLQDLDGRVVGDHDGRFLFDGLITNPLRLVFADVTNQIDDLFRVSPAPYSVAGPPFVATPLGTFQEVYKAAPLSRFYPTKRSRFGVTVVSGLPVTGDPLLDIGITNLRSVTLIERRSPWAVTTSYASLGTATLIVDDANGDDSLIRPAFALGMEVAIIRQDGAVLVSDGAALTVTSVGATTLGVSPGVPVPIPIGSTIRLSTTDTVYRKQYRLGVDLNVDLERGLLTYQEILPAWTALAPSPPLNGEALDVVVAVNNASTAPDRFPALDGSTEDDDHNRQFPILTPWVDSENALNGFLPTELSVIQAPSGSLRSATTDPLVGTGSLDATGTIITNLGGPWVGTVPKVHDLAEIRTGPNGPSTFRRITAVGASTVTVATAFASAPDTGFTFSVTVSATLESGTGTVSPVTTLTDVLATFITNGVLPGHTVVITSGVNVGLRRQITTVTSETVLQVAAFPATDAGETYRVDNPLETFWGTNSLVDTTLIPALSGETAVLSTNLSPLAEIPATDAFFNSVFLDIVTGVDGVSSTSTFTSAGSLFVSSDVLTTDYLFVRSGSVAGVYQIQSITSETSLVIAGTFPVNTSGIVFRIVRTVNVSRGPLQSILDSVLEAEDFLTTISPFQSLVTTLVAVAGDTGARATRLLTTDLDAREADVVIRQAQVATSVTEIQEELTSVDRLYDTRFVWIDARINLATGVLAERDMARNRRIQNQIEVVNSLRKLLSVESL
jgi:hypothetical protein